MIEFIRFFIKMAIIGITITALVLLGKAVEGLIIWSWLTSIFAIIRHVALLFDYMWDMDTTFQLVAYIFLLEIAYWAFESRTIVIKFFKPK